uniref:SDR family oxidoreductase n=1 Tax=Panagrolaimus sp. PS1159 TaxID=55785 RepID=A0AC35FE84_9BILA
RGSVTEEKTLKALIDETVSKFGKIDVLINNVGIANKEGIQNPRSMENLDYVLDVNLKSVIALTELAIPHLEKTKGNIVNVSSIGSQKTSTSVPYYCIAKAGLDHFARNYAAILAPKGIRVNNLNPGGTSTAFMSRHGIPQEAIDKAVKNYSIPLGRWASPSEMGEFLVFMASEKASYMTGQCINVDGGTLIDSPQIKLD